MKRLLFILTLVLLCLPLYGTTWVNTYTVYDRSLMTVTASSELNSGWVVGHIRDGSQQDIWLSNGRAGTQYVQLDLGSPQPMSFVRITTVYNNTQAIKDYEIDVSDDAMSWTSVAYGTLTHTFQRTVITWTASTHRYLRFIPLNSWDADCCYGIGELWIGYVPPGGVLWSADMNHVNDGESNMDPFLAIDKYQPLLSGSVQCAVNIGDHSTCWVPDYHTGPWEFTIDMGVSQIFDHIQYFTYHDAPRDMDVYVSNDGVTWGSPVQSFSGLGVCTSFASPCNLMFSSSHNNRYIKMSATTCAPMGGCDTIGYVDVAVGLDHSTAKPLIFVVQ